MDSVSAVPTLKRGLSEAEAEKLLMVARGRPGRAGEGAVFRACGFWASTAVASDFMLICRARFLARERAGSSIAARTDKMKIATISSIKVKARWGRLSRLVFMQKDYEHGHCQARVATKNGAF